MNPAGWGGLVLPDGGGLSILPCNRLGNNHPNFRENPLAGPHYIVHDKTDSVGVVVVEGVKKGQMLTGWVMQGNKTVRMKCLNTIPIGHKIALAPMKKGDTILKYGHDIGKAVAAIKKGGHVHVQNLKTKRW